MVLVAHPDDESIGSGILLQRIANPGILLCTNGAPQVARPWYSAIFRSRQWYARKRLKEFRTALEVACVRRVWTTTGIPDQQLHLSLEQAAAAIERCVIEHQPEAILSHAFEGGHPDHDACAVLARWAGLKFSLPVWEMPLYHRPMPSSNLVYQQFLRSNGDEIAVYPTPAELTRKKKMLAQHRSQAAVISEFDSRREVFRPQPAYDFGVNPSPALSTFAACDHISIEAALESFGSFLKTTTF